MADITKEDLRREIATTLKDADLASTSAKKVRQELEEKLDCNLGSRKKEIDDLVIESSKDKKKGKKNESEEDEEEEEEEEEEEASEDDKKKKRASTGKKPAAKKAKKGSDESEGSEASEGESEEEYSPKKSKPIRTRKLPPKKKKGSESDSDEDWGKKKGGKKGGGGGAYTKTMNLSPELAALVGKDAMATQEVLVDNQRKGLLRSQEDHPTSECPRAKQEPATCANCHGPHPASFRSCPLFPKPRATNTPLNPWTKPQVSTATIPLNIQNFPPLPNKQTHTTPTERKTTPSDRQTNTYADITRALGDMLIAFSALNPDRDAAIQFARNAQIILNTMIH